MKTMRDENTEENLNMGKSKVEEQKRGVSPRPTARTGRPAEWREVDGAKLIRAVSIAAAHGGAIRFGYTRDGGAYAIGIYGLGEPYTEYLRPGDNLSGFLDDLADAFSITDGPAAAGDGPGG